MPVVKRTEGELAGAALVEAALVEVFELDEKCFDSGWDEESIARREALVGELWGLCQSNPIVASESRSEFVAMFERTVGIEGQLRIERKRIAQALQEADTSLKQLGAFGERLNEDATLLNRLA